jgi:putative transposase
MARIARVVAPGVPHHVVQRGNRGQMTFFSEADYRDYKSCLSEWCRHCRVEIWAYCLMPNQVNHIAVPDTPPGFRSAFGEAHKQYTRSINLREGWRGHLWQGRFFSYPMDEKYLLSAARFIEMIPIYAGLAQKPGDYPWSSARPHLNGNNDGLVKVEPLLDRVGNWQEFLAVPSSTQEANALKRHEKSGRPLGDDDFIRSLEAGLGRTLFRRKPGPKSRRIFP